MSDFTYELPPEQDFFKALIEYVEHKQQNDIAELLKKCTMSFQETSNFTHKIWNTYWCSIIFSLPISELPNINQRTHTILKEYCDQLLPTNCGFLIKEINFVPQIVQHPVEQPADVEVVFEKQKNKIIDVINQAKFTIWIAVAWFTLDEIYDLLVEKSNEGIDIRIIVSKDEINKKKYDKYKDKLNIKGYPKFGAFNDNLMHNKFCVIDLQKVIHGSYNWSRRAEYNKETVEVVDDRKVAEEFAEQFKQLQLELNKE
ncbi:phospholipase D-like domain-containing protein [Zunongwangia endophytica]|uniref:phospholipase D n=1 Tax=Zunongwangia endophytica TaxID=1808945 RepID=A0ABV8HFX1_9FLAO|nr:phospholipase D-like domain-containing protein [Zunongwangia endophytica]MDN3594201.1 phospholipase D-like domain-containing protein [Zunongwangia endophytica]